MNSGRRNQVRPGARMRWMVTTKFRPVRMDEKPAMKMPTPGLNNVGVAEGGAEGRVKGPAGVHAAGSHGTRW